MSAPSAVVMMCGPLGTAISGGDVHALRLVAEWDKVAPGRVRLVAPASMSPNLPPDARGTLLGLRTPLDERTHGMGLYLINISVRMVLAIARAPRADVDVAASHLFHDVIPCVVRRAMGRNERVVAYVYHLIAEERSSVGLRSKVSIALERLSLALLKASRALVFVDSDSAAVALRERGFPDGNVHHTGNAYDPWVDLPPRRIASDTPLLITVGRLTEEKGVWDALLVAERLPEARVILVGDGPLRAEVDARAAALENVEVLGFVSEEEKWRQLRAGDLYLAPSREEGWGIAVGEALTAGLPVVAYDLPAYSHFGDRLTVVPTGDVDALTAAVRSALDAGPAHASADGLPRWSDLLPAEIATIGARS